MRQARVSAPLLPPTLARTRLPKDQFSKRTGDDLAAHATSMARAWADDWRAVIAIKGKSADLIAGLTAAAVALPLNVALALAAGLPVSSGLMAGAVGGTVAAIFGGSSWQVTGPAAALNLMVLQLTQQFGPAGVAAACLLIGVIQIGLAAVRAGNLIRWVPEAVLAGFTTGVGIKLLDGQIMHLFGADYSLFDLIVRPHDVSWLHDVNWHAALCGLVVVTGLLIGKKWPRIPAGLIGVGLVTALSVELGWGIGRVGEVSIGSLIPGWPALAADRWGALAMAAAPLALLAAIESLVSARAVDRLAKTTKPHNPSLELFGQGLANLATGLFRGMPVTGVIVRSSVSVQSGAKTRLAALTHALLLLGATLTLGGVIAVVPLAGLAGLLCFVGFRLIELHTLFHMGKEHALLAVAFVVTAVGTVTGHLMLGLTAGLLIALAHGRFFHKKPMSSSKNGNLRATLPPAAAYARRPRHMESGAAPAAWLENIVGKAHVPPSAFVHPGATVIGRVVLGEDVHIAADTSVRADEGSPFFIGPGSNVQDGVVMHALKDKYVTVGGERWAIYVGRGVSMAHQALVHGPCYVGDHTFIGFKAVVHDAVVGEGCFIGIGATVVGVEIPPRRYVPHGTVVSTEEQANALPPASAAHAHFNEDVVDVNRGLAAAYHADTLPQGAERAPFAVAREDKKQKHSEDLWSSAF